MTVVIVDTGPLVALFNHRDRWHSWVMDQMASMMPPLVTCEAVVIEAAFLIQRAGGKPSDLIHKVAQRLLSVDFSLQTDCASTAALMERYADTPMSLADACLVRMSEKIPNCRIFTLDSDFAHYRRNARQVIPLISPP